MNESKSLAYWDDFCAGWNLARTASLEAVSYVELNNARFRANRGQEHTKGMTDGAKARMEFVETHKTPALPPGVDGEETETHKPI